MHGGNRVRHNLKPFRGAERIREEMPSASQNMIITIFFISIKVIVFIALIKYLDVYNSGCMAYMCLISPLLPNVLERNLGRLVPVGSCEALWRPGREPVFYMWRHIVEHQNLYSEAFLWNWDCDDNEIMNMTNMIV